MSVTAIKTQLLASLNAMSSLKAVSAFDTANESGNYPYAVLTVRDGDGEFATTAHNLRRHGFMINVYQEQSKEGQGTEQAETIVTNVLDELYAHLDLVTTLSGTCKYARPVRYRATYENRQLDTRVLEIEIDAHEVVTAG